MKIALHESLDLLQDTYNYNHWVYSLLRPYIGNTVLEVGAGVGNMTQFLLRSDWVVCAEPDAELAERLQLYARRHLNLSVLNVSLEDISPSAISHRLFDTVVCVNVLEHILDHHSAVRKMLSLLGPNGRLLLYVPACKWAYGTLDTELSHYRRYSRRELHTLVREAGATVVSSRFVNFLGLWGWWWAGRVMKEVRIDVRKARMMDHLVPFVSALERLITPPLGQSLLCVLSPRRENTRTVLPVCGHSEPVS